MKLTLDQVKKVAKLANLPLTEDQEEEYSQQLSKILDYVDQLKEVETQGTDPTFNITGLSNIERADETTPSLSQEEALKNSAKKQDGMFVTKGVFDND